MTNDNRKLVAVVLVLGAICFVLAYCTGAARAASCVPLRSCSSTVTTACETPTPVVLWDASSPGSTGDKIAGYSLAYREPGGVFSVLVDLPVERFDTNDDGIDDGEFFRGVSLGVALQRYCGTCQPGTVYEFAVKAYDVGGRRSVAWSNAVSVCWVPLCIKPGPCN